VRIGILGSRLMGGNSERSSPELDMKSCSATREATTNLKRLARARASMEMS
jgi:hypothetical protein